VLAEFSESEALGIRVLNSPLGIGITDI